MKMSLLSKTRLLKLEIIKIYVEFANALNKE